MRIPFDRSPLSWRLRPKKDHGRPRWTRPCDGPRTLGMGRRNGGWGALACVGALFVCCVGPTYVVQQYAGPARPRESIAVFRVNGSGPRVATLDDGRLVIPEKDTRFHIEVLPGVHEVEVEDPNLGLTASRVRFVAEANKVYRIVVRDS